MLTYKKIYESWLNNPEFTEEERTELKNYTEEEKKKLFTNEAFRFGTAGIRREVGLSPQKLNKYTYRLLAVGYAKYLKTVSKNPSALVGHDTRENGIMYSIEIANILRNFGIKVYLAPENLSISTPIISYYIRKLKLDGGINVTASHNPPTYNGFKTYNSKGCQTSPEEEKIITENIPDLSEIFNLKAEIYNDFHYLPKTYVKDYILELIKTVPKNPLLTNKVKILFNSKNGTSKGHTAYMAYMLGFENFIEFEEPYIEGKTNLNPEEPISFEEAIEYAEREKISYICAQDPDGDRAAIAEKQRDGNWYFFNGNEIGVILAHFKYMHNKEMQNPYIVSTFVTGTFISKVLKDIPVHIANTGFKNIAKVVEQEESKGNNLLIAYEEAIGILLDPLHREKDGYQQIAFLMRLITELQSQGKNLKDYIEDLYKKYGYWRGFTTFYKISNQEEINSFVEKLKKVDLHKICDYHIDSVSHDKERGILAWNLKEDGWIKFRASGTEPKFKVYHNLYGPNTAWIEEQVKKLKAFLDNFFNQN